MKKYWVVAAVILSVVFCCAGLFMNAYAYSTNYDLSYTTIDDEPYSSKARAGSDGKILVFGRRQCGRTWWTLDSIAESDWIETADVDVAFIDIDGDPKSDIIEFAKRIDSEHITFCYGKSSYSDYNNRLSYSDSTNFLPIVAYIDGNNNLITVTSDMKSSDEIYYTMFGKYPEKSVRSLENCTVSGLSAKYEYTGEAIDVKDDLKIYSEKGRLLKLFTHYNRRFPALSKDCGKYTITVNGLQDYEGTSIKVSYYIVPKATKIKKLTIKDDNNITVEYKKSAQATGYQIACSTSKNFTSDTTYKVRTTKTKVSLKCGSGTYYIKVRPYYVDSGKRIYGAWSDVYEYSYSNYTDGLPDGATNIQVTIK